jgi:hypothetical protein
MTHNFNRLQQLAFDTFTKSAPGTVHVLYGRGGTGKSYVMDAIAKEYPSSKHVVKLAPTHKAAQIIGGKTIHSFFGLKPTDSAPDAAFTTNVKSPKDTPQLVIVDEISMVNLAVLYSIIEWAGRNKVKLILSGDPYQLPPVNDANGILIIEKYKPIELIENMRQRAGSVIPAMAELCRQYDVGFYPEKHVDGESTTDVLYAPKVTVNDAITMVAKLISTGISVNAIAHANKDVIAINEGVVRQLYPTESEQTLWVPGTTIVTQAPVLSGSTVLIENARELQINDSIPTTQNITTENDQVVPIRGALVDAEGFKLFLVDYNYQAVVENVRKAWINKFKEVRKKHGKNSGNMQSLQTRYEECGLQDMVKAYHSYCSTIHKAQGSTHGITVLYYNFKYLGTNKGDIEQHNRLMYVAMTRPRDTLVVLEAF